jgi:TP901 family phage tail tape measure protein
MMADYDLGTYGAELVLDDSKFAKSMKNAEKDIYSVDKKIKGFGKNLGMVATGALAGLGTALVGIGVAGTKMADDLDNALNQLQAATGATDDEMKQMEESMKNLYNMNLGESFADIAQSMTSVRQATGLTGKALEDTTKNALMLRDTFGADVNESVRAADQLMKQFGISSEQAFDLIAQGYQKGLDKSGDFLDTLNEYSVYFETLGYDAEGFFNTLIAGSESGAFNMDKVADAIKEFGIRTKDMSESSRQGFEALGLNADEMFKKFAQGGETAQKATQEVFKRLGELKDPLLRNTIGVQLMGTQFEDLEADTILALGNIQDKVNATGDTLNKIAEVRYDSIGEAFQGIGRNLQTAMIEPIQQHLLPLLNDFAQFIMSNMPQIKSFISTTFQVISDVIGGTIDVVKKVISAFSDANTSTNSSFSQIKENISFIIENIKGIFSDFAKFAKDIWKKYGDEILATAKATWEAASQTIKGLIEIIRGVIKTVLSLISGDWKGAWEGIKSIAKGVWDTIGGVIKTAINGVHNTISTALEIVKNVFSTIWNGIKQLVSTTVSKISSSVTSMKTSLSNTFDNILSTAKRVWDGIKSAITSPIQTAKDTVMGIIDAIKTAFSNLEIKIPKPKLPHIDVSWKSFGIGDLSVKVPTFDVSWYATGGIFDKPSIVGLAENGREAILPLQNPTAMNPFADAVYERLRDNIISNSNTNKTYQTTSNHDIVMQNTFNFEIKGIDRFNSSQARMITDMVCNEIVRNLKIWGLSTGI